MNSEPYIFKYIHPSGLERYRFLFQRKHERHQRYFVTLEEAIEYRDRYMTGYHDKHAPIKCSFSVSFN